MFTRGLYFLMFLALLPGVARAGECPDFERDCVIDALLESAEKIEEKSWRDQTYREIAKTLAFEGRVDEAIALIAKIETPDTQAMSIRGIGMAVAERAEAKQSPALLAEVFTKLRAESEKIEHPPSYAIALTYIAMAQAFAGDDEGAWKTAADMDNDALRHKAYGETAEIQAEKGKPAAAMKSIGFIESEAYRNKAYSIISRIFADQGLFDAALAAAEKISNAYKKAQALQYALDKETPRELPH